jgi:ABC-2 type transport system permease protein
MTLANVLQSWVLEVRFEFLKLVRTPAYVFFTLLFPLMFYIFFGVLMGQRTSGRGPSMAVYLVGTYGAFGVIGVSLFGFGVSLAVERGLGWLQLKRASPMPPYSYLAAKAAVSMLFSAVLVGLLFTLAIVFGGVRMAPVQWAGVLVALVFGSLPFCVLGLAIGSVARANTAPALVNTLYLPMAICSGLWFPIQALPAALQSVAPWLPPYHLAQIALSIIDMPHQGSIASHALALSAFTVIFTGLAMLAQRRESETM